MRSGAAIDHEGYFHQASLYGSDHDFLAVVVPFLEGGLSAGEPTLVALSDRNTALVRTELGEPAGITFLPGDQYTRPASTIARYRDLFAAHVDAGATQIRGVGEVPHPGAGLSWDVWGRYEAAANEAFAEFPVWGLCPYDVRITPDVVLDEVVRVHPHLAFPGERHERNPGHQHYVEFLRDRADGHHDPLEAGPPVLDLVDPTPYDARRAAEAVGASIGLDPGAAEGLVMSVSEVVANATLHGRSPVRLRLWAGDGRVLASVTDQGSGIPEPLAGLLPVSPDASGGRGLWVAHQLCSEVRFGHDSEGFTVRLTGGELRRLRSV